MMSRRGNRHFKKQLNNQGFSLLELLVVIAIIAVVSLLVTVGLTVLNKGNAKKANKNLYSSLSELKTSTMAKNGNWYMEIGKDGDSYVFTTYKDSGSPLETYKCSASRISIVYEAGTSSYDVDDYTIMVKFSKADGSCDSVTATKSGMDPVELKNTATSGTFKVTSSGVDYESKLWYKTGKVTTSN